ncbi:hypothetical protein AJ79_09108 [Helicocarpus griseus UAMH5409]|uniref:Mitochondrial intermembrane space import and assembly protein 40 n=1 Tax=Helicocarpus griseus UAMH5409 TaxID=1447875 RepID=A0A2B7WME4_9EURO|nr:hypothetical protein AJ79_09108 [Helicocarpus griseus UAMH5409]
MYRPAARSLLQASTPRHIRLAQARRLISTAPPSRKSGSWKGTVVRWGLAAGAVYYYNTSSVFADEPGFSFQPASQSPKESEDDLPLQTLDSITAAKKAKAAAAKAAAPAEITTPSATESSDLAAAADVEVAPSEAQPMLLTPGELEEEADSEGAFNPETGEINWDCPCLGGMAHGPCGEEFRAAFSCFVYSTEEPKGMDCIEKFEGMQTCFRQHPEIYPTEDEEKEADAQLAEASSSNPETSETPAPAPAQLEKSEQKPAAPTPSEEKSTTS